MKSKMVFACLLACFLAIPLSSAFADFIPITIKENRNGNTECN